MNVIIQPCISRRRSKVTGQQRSGISHQSVQKPHAQAVERVSRVSLPLQFLPSPGDGAAPLQDPAALSFSASTDLSAEIAPLHLEHTSQRIRDNQRLEGSQRDSHVAPQFRKKELHTRATSGLRLNEALPDISPEVQYLHAWRFRQPNPYALLFPVCPEKAKHQTCPFFFPGCSCMTAGLPYHPYYYSNTQRHKAAGYINDMAYIPGNRSPVRSHRSCIGDAEQFRQPPVNLLKISPAGGKSIGPLVRSAPFEERLSPSTFNIVGAEEVQNHNRSPDDYTQAFVTFNGADPLCPYNQDAESGKCYVCHAGGVEGTFSPGCSIFGPQTGTECWVHGICVGFSDPPAVEVDRWCRDCDNELDDLQSYEKSMYQRVVYANKMGIEDHSITAFNSRVISSAGSFSPTHTIGFRRMIERGMWGSTGKDVVGGSNINFSARKMAEGLLATAKSRSARGKRKLAQKHKQIGDVETSSVSNEPKPKRKKSSQGIHDEYTQTLIVRFLKEEIAAGNLTEQKWQAVSNKLAKAGIEHSQWAIKAWWSRKGREQTGFDERQNPTGRRLVTSKQDPGDRRKAREQNKVRQGRVLISSTQEKAKKEQMLEKRVYGHTGFRLDDNIYNEVDGAQSNDDHQSEQTRDTGQHLELDHSCRYG